MTTEKLQRAKAIEQKIAMCRTYIERLKYTQAEEVVDREMDISFNGDDGGVTIPASLFRIVGKLALAEYEMMLIELQREFDSL